MRSLPFSNSGAGVMNLSRTCAIASIATDHASHRGDVIQPVFFIFGF
jgi:hypothetical protein